MKSVFEFLDEFATLLEKAGARFAITGGMACVRYGLQQTTKDSDWIVRPEDLERLRSVLESFESQMPPAAVTYRPIFGAPLDARWHRGGWTSHVAIRPLPSELPHHLDFFGQPPRVADWSVDRSDGRFADRGTVARMKKTDRDRDWPMVDGLASQDIARGVADGLLHLQSVKILRMAWERTSPAQRDALIRSRPVLGWLDSEADDLRLEAAIRAERLVWESVNRERYRIYQSEWKAFYRRWQSEDDWHWPTTEPFATQHDKLVAAAEHHRLPENPLPDLHAKKAILDRAIRRASVLANWEPTRLKALLPPLSELLP